MINRESNRVKLLMSFVDYIQKTHAVVSMQSEISTCSRGIALGRIGIAFAWVVREGQLYKQ